jgi:hypothetical protein
MMRSSDPLDPRAVLGALKARPGSAQRDVSSVPRPALIAPARDAIDVVRAGTKERPQARTKELRELKEHAMT